MNTKKSFIALPSSLTLALLLLISAFYGAAYGQQRAQVTILQTTDLHGHIYPIDYYTNKPDMNGLAKAATLIKQARKENPNLLLLDSGDTIQGTPLVYYHNKKNNAPPDPMMLVMNALKYDSMARVQLRPEGPGKGAARSAVSLALVKHLSHGDGRDRLQSLPRQRSGWCARRHPRTNDARHS
jgi:hypothetical protein